MIAVRIVCMDYYMSAPVEGLDPRNSTFRGSSVVKLPIIRIFGSVDDGSKVCLHVHGTFPYIYVPCDGDEDSKRSCYQLASGLDKALNISQGQASSSQQHVYEVTVVSATPIYGYHAHQRPFFKISFYNPQTVKRACPLLQNGSVLGRPLQPHEAHIPYHQQFMIDHNLHGMNLIKLRRVHYRTKVGDNITENFLPGVKKVSVCSLEMDARVEDILNTSEIGEVNPGIECICEEERMRRRHAGEDTQLSKFLTSERSMTAEATASSEKYRILLLSKLESTPESQDSLFDLSCLDNTVINEDADFLMSMLKENESAEEDSVLSQRGKGEDDEEPDLRVPLASVTTPVKVLLGDINDGEDDIWNDSFFLTPEDEAIAQVDGSHFDDVNSTSKYANNTNPKLKIQIPSLTITNSRVDDGNNRIYKANLTSKVMKEHEICEKKINCKRILSGKIKDFEAKPNLNTLISIGKNRNFKTTSKLLEEDKKRGHDYEVKFSNLTINIKEDTKDSICKNNFQGKKCLIGKKNFKIEQLDGRNSSSSSEDEAKMVVAKKRRRVGKVKTSSSPYPALQVVVRKKINCKRILSGKIKDFEAKPNLNTLISIGKNRNFKTTSKLLEEDKKRGHDYEVKFSNLTINIKEDTKDSICKNNFQGKKCLIGKKNFKIEQLDGRNSSSSSEDEAKMVVAKKRRRVGKVKTSSSPYPALQVVVRSPVRVVRWQAGRDGDKHGSDNDEIRKPLREDKVKVTVSNRKQTNVEDTERTITKEIPSRTVRNTRRTSSVSSNQNIANTAKRKLSFQQLDATVVEETFPCRYSPARNDRLTEGPNKKSVNYNSEEERVSTTAVEKSVSYVVDNVEIGGPYENQRLKDGSFLQSDSSTDIFSTETSNDASVQQPIADRYDAAISYIPVPGPSKDAKIVISGEMTSSSDILTPHQGDPNVTISSSSDKNATSGFSGNLTAVSDDSKDVTISGKSKCSKKTIITVSHEGNRLLDDVTLCINDQNTVASPTNRTLLNDLTVTDLFEDNLICAEKTAEGHCVLIPKYNPPSADLIRSTMTQYGIPDVRNEDPYYSDPTDVSRSVEVGHNVLKIKSKTTVDLQDFESEYKGFAHLKLTNTCVDDDKVIKIVPAKLPPTRREVELWAKARLIRKSDEVQAQVRKREKVKCVIEEDGNGSDSDLNLTLSPCTPVECNEMDSSPQVRSTSKEPENSNTIDATDVSLQKVLEQSRLFKETSSYGNTSHQITGASLNNTHGFKFSLENYQNVKSRVVQQHLTTLVVELHVDTRGALLADPELDAIVAIFYAKLDDEGVEAGVVAVNADEMLPGTGYTGTAIHVGTELELFTSFLDLVRKWDPDVLIGYEAETASWGYLVERGYKLGLNYGVELSRIPGETMRAREDVSEMNIVGRIVLDLWRLLRHELALTGYSFENVVYHVLHERVAVFSAQDLTNWWVHKSAKVRSRTIDFYMYRVRGVLRLLDHFDLLGRTSELARLFGILFYEVLSRGSQFRVESMMLRLAKPANYIAVSPSVQQRAHMRAPEFIPLILEPESKFYKDPVIVLDFQSLYPSMIIAYNYCFSTCVGRCEHLSSNSAYEFGASNLRVSRTRIRKLLADDSLHFSPSGIGFVKPSVRDGILPRMLREILDTRLLVKNAMKRTKSNKTLQRVLHSRQLGLKLIANVTYGYTAANFSGRMPAVEIADSVVGKGRETLQRAIKLVENNPEWNARVVYGDTDSLFVLTPGRSRAEAFRIGAEIAESVTNSNPSPVRLKLEKVYQPCILQTKKRYVGYLYETPDQATPDFDAKGIETVRRDGCPAVGKMLEKCLKMLFETRDVSAIKRYVQRQFHKLLSGRVSVQDLTFAKEYRGEAGYRPGACVPALELAKKWKTIDRRREPRRSQRVPYVVINGPPGLPLIRLVRSPTDLLNDPSLRPNALYYITKVIIPPINRCFLLIGADLNAWFNEMPRKQVQYLPTSSPTKAKKSTISQYFATTSCACCSKQTRDGLCAQCADDPQSTAVILHEKVREWERSYNQTYKICQSCCGRMSELPCISLDCPVLYRLVQTERDAQQANFVRDLIDCRLSLDF